MIKLNNTVTFRSTCDTVEMVAMDDTHIVIYARENSSNRKFLICADLSSGTPVFGDLVEIEPLFGASLCRLDDTHFVLTYTRGQSPYNGRCLAGSIDGTTVSVGNVVEFTSDEIHGANCTAISASSFIVAYENSVKSGLLVAGTVSGITTSMVQDSGTTFQSSAISSVNIEMMDSSRFVVVFKAGSAGSYSLEASTGTVSGTTITIPINTSTTLYTGDGGLYRGNATCWLDSTHLMVAYEDSSTNGYLRGITVSGSTLTMGTVSSVISSADPGGLSIAAFSSSYCVVTYRDNSGSDYTRAKIATLSGTTVSTFSNEMTVENSGTAGSQCIVCPTSNSYVVGFEDGAGKVNYDPYSISAEITTQSCTSVTDTTTLGNGNIIGVGYNNCTTRGFCYKVYDGSDPTTADSTAYDTGTFSAGAYTKSITGLTANTYYSVRAYVINSSGTYYGTTVNQYTNGITSPANVYADDTSYATCHADSGDLKVKLSKDAGATWSSELTKTFGSSETTETYGDGTTENWGLSWTTDDLNSATDFKLRITIDNEVYSTWSFAGWGFAMTAGKTITGIKVDIKGYETSSVFHINHITVTAYYGTSPIAVSAGSEAFASDGRKIGEGAGAGTGLVVYYDGNNWIRPSDDTTVVA